MRTSKLTAVLIAGMLLFTFSCNNRRLKDESKTATTTAANDFDLAVTDSAVMVTPQEEEKDPVKKIDIPEPKSDWDKKIVKTANLRLEIGAYKLYNDRMRQLVKQFGGYISSEEQTQTDEQIENDVTIKVPVERFEECMNSLPGNDSKIITRTINSSDVTAEYIDVKSRLASRKQVMNKYLEFLKQAKNMDEMLEVQKEINEMQENIESAAGRADYLSHAAAFSTINLSYYQLINGATDPHKPSAFLKEIKNAFKNGLGWVGTFFIALVALWPFLLVGLTAWFIYRRTRKYKLSSVQKSA